MERNEIKAAAKAIANYIVNDKVEGISISHGTIYYPVDEEAVACIDNLYDYLEYNLGIDSLDSVDLDENEISKLVAIYISQSFFNED